ncbi:hypothetical protein JHC42_03915 [Pseudomonas sp. OA3]|jgi:hypothetical protein|nr:hypothetical protein [Pseudomonas sp. OA3]
MQIPAFVSTTALHAAEVAKGAPHNAAQLKTASAQAEAGASSAPAVSSTMVNISGLLGPQKSQGAPGMSMNQLNAMLDTSLKMQEIRNDASIPAEVKEKLLNPLAQANKEALNIANAKAEQEEKSKIIEASNEDAEAIRKAGEEIAASAGTQDTSQLAPEDANAPSVATSTASSTGQTQPGPATSSVETVTYSVSPAPAPTGENIDTHA